MRLKSAFCLLILLFNTSCISNLTYNLWHPYYEEDVDQFLVSQDGQYVVFLGKKYHYVFNDQKGIVKRLLFSPYHFLMSMSSTKTRIKLLESNELEASVAIGINVGEPDPIGMQHLLDLGFNYNNPDKELMLRINLHGTRYLADKRLATNADRLNRGYTFKIYTTTSTAEGLTKAALTPITATIDATLFIGNVLLIPFRKS